MLIFFEKKTKTSSFSIVTKRVTCLR